MPPHENQVNFEPYTKTYYISTNTKTKSVSIHTQISSQFWSPPWTKPISMPTQNQVNYHWNQVNFGQHVKAKLISTTPTKREFIDTHTKNKSFSARTEKPSQLDPHASNQVNFDP